MTSPGLSAELDRFPHTPTPTSSTSASAMGVLSPPSLARLPRAHLVVTSAHGVVEVERDGARYIGVLDAPGATVTVGSALSLKILCRAENAYPYVVEDPQDLTVHVLAIDDAEIVGSRQLLHPGVGLHVAISSSEMNGALAPPLPVVVGSSLDDALANAVLADTLEPDPHPPIDDDDQDVITGSLRRLPLAELVQALSFAKKTAAIHLRIAGGSGTIHLDDGEITCAQLDDGPHHAVVRGAAAFHRLLAHDQGSFRVSFEREWHERNVHASTQMLLLDGLRMIDEAKHDGRDARTSTARSDTDTRQEAHDVCDDTGEIEVDDASIEEITFDLEELDVRPAMRAHLASPVLPLSSSSAARVSMAPRSGRRLPPVLSSVLVAPRSSTR